MIHAFWQWLIRADVRALLFAALVLLVLSSVVWILPPGNLEAGLPPAPDGTPAHDRPVPANGGAERAPAVIPGSDQSPFASVFLNEWLQAAALQAQLASQQPPDPPPENPAAPAPGAPEAPVAAPATRPVTLLYRGLMVRPDGVPMALVELAGGGGTAFYETGELIDGVRLDAIGRDALGVSCGTTTAVLPLGETATLEVPAP